MAQQFSKTDQRRITFLSLLSSATTLPLDADESEAVAYAIAQDWLNAMEKDGFFEDADDRRPTPASSGRSGTSRQQGSSSRPSNGGRGRDQGQRPAFSGQYRDPDGPPTENQVNAVLKLTDDYSSDELWDMSKAEVGALISDLKG